MSHIAIKLDGIYLATAEDTEIDIEDSNPYFNDQSETMSLPFTVPLDGNREAFGNVECIESDENLRSVEKKIMDIEVDGIMLRQGKCGNIDDQEITDSVALQMVSAVYSLDEYLDGVKCRDVELIDEIPIGETIGNVRARYTCDLTLYMDTEGWHDAGDYQTVWDMDRHTLQTVSKSSPDEDAGMTINFPALGFSYPGVCKTSGGSAGYGSSSPYDSDGTIGKNPTVTQSFINVTDTYPTKKYCNARVCYMHYKEEDGESSDEVDNSTTDQSEYGRYNPYLVLEADRPASGICFYILYFLDCLFGMFKEDGVAYDNSELVKIDDMCRLAFFTTHCKYDTKGKGALATLRNVDQINSWLRTRNIDTTVKVDDSDRTDDVDSICIDGTDYIINGPSPFTSNIPYQKEEPYGEENQWGYREEVQTVKRIFYKVTNLSYSITADVMTMYANSMNFPDADAKDILDSLWGSFGIKFFLDQQSRLIKPMFIRDIFRSQENAIVFPCEVITAIKSIEKITGFRMKYSNQSDSKEREENITLGKTDYDTTYDYQDYRNLDISIKYDSIINQAYDTNMTCYVDLSTGNMYRIKIDSDAETRDEYHPVLFEVRQLTGIEIGDCSTENDEFIEEVSSNFQPIVFNDVNFRNEKKSSSAEIYTMKDESGKEREVEFKNTYSQKQVLAAFISEEMWHEEIARSIAYPMGSNHISIDLVTTIKTKESYDVSSSDDGDSPLQSLDWGLAIALMRGGGSEAHIDYYDYNYDMFGNCKYRMVAGSDYGMSLDSIDCYSQVYDYNGTLPGIGSGEGGSFDGTYSKAESRSIVNSYFNSKSNYDLLSGTSSIYTTSLVDYDNVTRYFIFAQTSDASQDYFTLLQGNAKQTQRNIMSVDANSSKILVGSYESVAEANYYCAVITQFLAIINGTASSGTVSVPVPEGVTVTFGAYDQDRISLKIRSYIEAPQDMVGPDGQQFKKGDPLCDPLVKNRGLYDQFMSEYAHFLLHRKKVILEIQCEVAALTGIQWHRRYRFGDYVGWINKIKTHITSAKGIESVTVELFVL